MEQAILFILATAPCAGIGLFIYLKNAHSPGSYALTLKAIGYGLLSFLLAMVVGHVLSRVTNIDPGNTVHLIIRAVVFVGLMEEGCKFLFLRGVVYRSPHFSQAIDGIYYAVQIGMGFALGENMLYLFGGDASALMVRMVSAVPAHGMFAVLMGFFVGEAKVFPSSAGLYSALGLGFATLAHGYYDNFLFFSDLPGLWWHSALALVVMGAITFYAFRRRELEHEED